MQLVNSYSTGHLHPPERAGALESPIRMLIQDPRRILRRYIRPGMTVLDLGCGTGYFTLAIAELLEMKGQVIAADAQQGMLDILEGKLRGSAYRPLIQILHNRESALGVTEKVDFILAFYSFHEMGYVDDIVHEIRDILKPGTRVFVSEQKFHVSGIAFQTIIRKLEHIGLEIRERPRIFLSRTVVMRPKGTEAREGTGG